MIYNDANFPELPRNWASLSVDDSVDSAGNSNKKLKSKDALDQGRFPVIDQGQSDISGYSDDESLVVEASEQNPVILFGDHTRLLKQITQPFVPGADGTKLFRAKSFWDTRFVYQMLRAIKLPDKGYARHYQYLRSSILPLPPLPEQKRIADKLDVVLARVDVCRDCLDNIPAILKCFRRSILAAATSGKLTEEWRTLRFGKHQDSNEESADLPQRWIKTEIRDCIFRMTGGVSPRREDYTQDGLLVLNKGDIKLNGGVVVKAKPNRIPHAYAALHASKIALRGATLVTLRDLSSKADFLGLIGQYREDEPALLTQGMYMLEVSDLCLNSYLIYFSNSPMYRDAMKREKVGATQVHLRNDQFLSVSIPLPPIDEQAEIVRRIESLFAYANSLESRCAAARAQVEKLTPSTLAKAFRGELVQQDPKDGSASELLKRLSDERTIKATTLRKGASKKNGVSTMKIKSVIPVIEALRSAKKSLTAQALLAEAGYPTDAESELVERFFLDIRKELESKHIERIRRGNDDYFSIVQ